LFCSRIISNITHGTDNQDFMHVPKRTSLHNKQP
jgi:hypothetical protein